MSATKRGEVAGPCLASVVVEHGKEYDRPRDAGSCVTGDRSCGHQDKISKVEMARRSSRTLLPVLRTLRHLATREEVHHRAKHEPSSRWKSNSVAAKGHSSISKISDYGISRESVILLYYRFASPVS